MVIEAGGAPRAAYKPSDFEMVKKLGQGSFSQVYEAALKATGEHFALKVMDKQFIQKENKVHLVKHERSVMDKLHHPSIVRLCFTFQDHRSLFMGLELCPGGELWQQIRWHAGYNAEDAAFYTAEVVEALEFLKSKGIIHRDLKPENLFLTAAGHLKLGDFGSSKDLNEPPQGPGDGKHRNLLGRKNSFVGTAEYVSPEILKSKAPTCSTDLWALGCLIYQLLSAICAFKGESEYVTFQRILSVDYVLPDDFSPNASRLIKNLLLEIPDQRIGAREEGFSELKAHPFFAGIDWHNLRQARPPARLPAPPDESMLDSDEDDDWDLTAIRRVLPGRGNSVEKSQEQLFAEQANLRPKRRLRPDKFVAEGEHVVYASMVKKYRGLFPKRRLLLLTDKPRLLYVDLEKESVMGEVPWTSRLKVEVKDERHFDIITPNRYDPCGPPCNVVFGNARVHKDPLWWRALRRSPPPLPCNL